MVEGLVLHAQLRFHFNYVRKYQQGLAAQQVLRSHEVGDLILSVIFCAEQVGLEPFKLVVTQAGVELDKRDILDITKIHYVFKKTSFIRRYSVEYNLI